eukprot:CAMPEP_0178963178 /NCGR_PEP_ID=MMETSP0789-20121207/14855_1 /TAXON_ID=3005 /ORGANISM="Rhizosolenia setigera, Strain CCMP 1694" /LENGTH=1239 /DNA_ID=CAMNT_0020647569 /DNA_START=158 /DNA_END=3877 /DNA_ORIENTATION=-
MSHRNNHIIGKSEQFSSSGSRVTNLEVVDLCESSDDSSILEAASGLGKIETKTNASSTKNNEDSRTKGTSKISAILSSKSVEKKCDQGSKLIINNDEVKKPPMKKQKTENVSNPSVLVTATTKEGHRHTTGNQKVTQQNKKNAGGNSSGKKKSIIPDYVNLEEIPECPPPPPLLDQDLRSLEGLLQFYSHDRILDKWRPDWAGNLELLEKEIVVHKYSQTQGSSQIVSQTKIFQEYIFEHASDASRLSFRGISLLFSHIYHRFKTPPMARRILAYAFHKNVSNPSERFKLIKTMVKRLSYDPVVLQQDGWETVKSPVPHGPSGGAFLIGQKVKWQGFEAVVIAFVKDESIGDLWKAMFVEDLETFDLESDELRDAINRYEKSQKKNKKSIKETTKPIGNTQSSKVAKSSSTRFASAHNFNVDGIEQGIILASTYNGKAQPGVLWPARVLHASEIKNMPGLTSRRSSQKNMLHVVFLAPYWNGTVTKTKSITVDPTVSGAKSSFSTGTLFEVDSVEVSTSTIQKYPFELEDDNSFSIDKLRDGFRFLGLPKVAFSRYLDSHRLALGFRYFAKKQVQVSKTAKDDDNVRASMTETHALSLKTPKFPQALLSLPFDYMISQMPSPAERAIQLGVEDGDEAYEQVLKLDEMYKMLSPPNCWGKNVNGSGSNSNGNTFSTPQSTRHFTPVRSPEASMSASKSTEYTIYNFASEYLLKVIGDGKPETSSHPRLSFLGNDLQKFISELSYQISSLKSNSSIDRRKDVKPFLHRCLVLKSNGEDALHSSKLSEQYNVKNLLNEWRKTCEKLYTFGCIGFSRHGVGNGVTVVLTDSRCNQHITGSGSFERSIRLPAAIKAAKNAGAGKKYNIPLLTKVDEYYMDIADKRILPRAHMDKYLRRLKSKIAALPVDAKGQPLTDDSDGEGGEDTMGSRGSYTAAVAGVASALKAVDMVVGGESVNAFCAVRPPGHHAGRELRPMDAISNGFCLLNAAACAAIYAAIPPAEGGHGLKRVCVIDFDVHHGNGTQDILCSTHDSRFLYVSLHAGGAHINGYDDENDANNIGLGHGAKQEGIYPGRCGDKSPHPGVLNIPLGRKVTSIDMGNALISTVEPAVKKFCPELIILSAGFDAHKNDPMGLGGLSTQDFANLTQILCQIAARCCSGRVVSILEGGYGVPCCQPKGGVFLPTTNTMNYYRSISSEIPDSMQDVVDPNIVQTLDKCAAEGFLECVQEHVSALERCNKIKYGK